MLVDPILVDPGHDMQCVLGLIVAVGAGATEVCRSELPGLSMPKRISRGVYTVKHHSFNHFLPKSKESYKREFPDFLPGGMESYGVCDTPDQFLGSFGDLLERSPHKFVVSFTHVRKDAQPPEGGWRWHKWGPYVGKGQPSMEYLFDETGFPDGIYCYHIYRISEGEYVEPEKLN